MTSKFRDLKEYWSIKHRENPSQLFVDHEFSASLKSLVYQSYHRCGSSIHEDIYDASLSWKRPYEICKRIGTGPKFIVKGAKTYDLNQGSIGNCWFIAGATHLALRPELFKQVVPEDQEFDENYAGIFHFFFWQYGEWKEVIIDDLLPYDNYRDSLFFLINPEQPHEFWAALMEKAYAKLHGCYESLHGGMTGESMVDISGGIAHHLKLQSDAPYDLFQTMLKSHQLNTLFACCIFTAAEMEERRTDGLVGLHAYCITNITEVTDIRGRTHQLLQLRNPWGAVEWNGDWSDKSSVWSLISSENKRWMLEDKDDGEFWMNFQDWVDSFEELQMCFIPPTVDTSGKKRWEQETHHGSWVRGITAGGRHVSRRSYWNNPQITVTISVPDENDSKCTMIVSLMKKNLRKITKNDDDIPVNFDIYQLNDNSFEDLSLENVDRRASYIATANKLFTFRREVTHQAKYDPGHYVIIPYTQFADMEAPFVVRVFTEMPITKGYLDEPTGPISEPEVSVEDVFEIFEKYSGRDFVLDSRELQHFLNDYFKQGLLKQVFFSREAARNLLVLFDQNLTGRLGFDEAKKMITELEVWHSVFLQFDKNHTTSIELSELRLVFKQIGFAVSKALLEIMSLRYAGKDGKIDFNEFLILFSKLTSYYRIFKKHSVESNGRITLDLDQFLGIVL